MVEQRRPALPLVFALIVGKVTPLAQRGEIAWMIVAGVVVEIRTGQTDPRDSEAGVSRKLDETELGEQGGEGGAGKPATRPPRSSRHTVSPSSNQRPSPR